MSHYTKVKKPSLEHIMSFLKKIYKQTVLFGADIPVAYKTRDVCPKWPFKPNMRLATKDAGSTIEIGLDHENKQFIYQDASIRLVAKTPTAILKMMALNGKIHLSNAMRNWSNIWATVDNGETYVLAKDLRHGSCTDNGLALIEGIHHYVPPSI